MLRLRPSPACRTSSRTRWLLPRRHSSTAPQALPPLPPVPEWPKVFRHNTGARRDRAYLKTPDTAASLAAKLLTANARQSQGEGKVIIEAFPGPGALSRAFLQLPSSSVRKLIILEDDEMFLKHLMPLQDADPRVTVVPMSGHNWDTYVHLEEHGILQDVQTAPWEADSIPDLHFVTHLPHNVKGEQLIAQLFRSIPERAWLFQYGRVPMSILLSDYVWSRLTGPPGSTRRCKLSVIGEASADIQEVVPPELLAPYEDHFYPSKAAAKAHAQRKVGQPIHAFTAVPYADQVIQKGQTEQWDYCLRKLFVLRNTPLKTALGSLAPGATSLLDELTTASIPREQRVNISKKVRDLNVSDWALVMRAFGNWPFKPTDLLISGAFMSED